MYSVRKLRGENKYAVRVKSDKGIYVNIVAYDTREEAKNRMREEIHKQVEKEPDIINGSDTEIEV